MCSGIAAASLRLSLSEIVSSSSVYCATKANLRVQPVNILLASLGQKVCLKTRKKTDLSQPIHHSWTEADVYETDHYN